jgi:tetratricopeptide (TPR) repeat protein
VRNLKKLLLILLGIISLAGCASLVSNATNGMAANLSKAIKNQQDPAIVRDGAPAYLLMLDSFVEGSPDDESTLTASAELYAMYGALFADQQDRAKLLTGKAMSLGARGLCASNSAACGLDDKPFAAYQETLGELEQGDVPALFSYCLAWAAYIKVNSGEMAALSKLPRAQAAFQRVLELDPDHERVAVEHYLGVLDTARPPALGGDFESGRAHFENAIERSGGRDLSVQVDFAKFYARTLYERELHDQLLNQVLEADPIQDGMTLFNVLAQQDAQVLLDSADDYF